MYGGTPPRIEPCPTGVMMVAKCRFIPCAHHWLRTVVAMWASRLPGEGRDDYVLESQVNTSLNFRA